LIAVNSRKTSTWRALSWYPGQLDSV